MNLLNIKNKVEELRYPGGIKALAESVGMTEQNLHRCVRENKIQAQDLENIANELNVSILCFFDQEVDEISARRPTIDEKMENLNKKIRRSRVINGNNNQLNETGAHDNINGISDPVLLERIKFLEEKISDRDKWLREKDERIEELKERIEELKQK